MRFFTANMLALLIFEVLQSCQALQTHVATDIGRQEGFLEHTIGKKRLLTTHAAFASSFLANPERESYILHNPCGKKEGLGSKLHRLRPVIDVAQRFSLRYVCEPKDFRTHNHKTGDLGFLFGCIDHANVIGDMASFDDVNDMVTEGKLLYVSSEITDVGTESIHLKNLSSRGASALYYIGPCAQQDSWGASYPWFRSQYRMIMEKDEAREAAARSCGGMQGRTRIVVHVRRGDDPHFRRGRPVHEYVTVLNSLFSGKISGVAPILSIASAADIIFLSETPESDTEMLEFKDFERRGATIEYRLGKPEIDKNKARQRFVRDMDCMSVSDVLILSGGTFSALGAALQRNGIALVFWGLFERNDLPHAIITSLSQSDSVRGQGNTNVSVALLPGYAGLPNVVGLNFDGS